MKETDRINSIAIIGGGTAGWMAAAKLSKTLKNTNTNTTIHLIESDKISSIGVGEATVPYIREFIRELGMDEARFIQNTDATYKLGILFDGWKTSGHQFFHPFAEYGHPINNLPFPHIWTKLQKNSQAYRLDRYCLASQMALNNKMALPLSKRQNELASFNYAFHLDASLFACELKNYALKQGVKLVHNKVVDATQDDRGNIQRLHFEDGGYLDADFYIDCSGFHSVLIDKVLKVPYTHWNHYLLCDRAIAVQSESKSNPPSYTLSKAHPCGWRWQIPLQNRCGNGMVYASQFMSNDKALKELHSAIPEEKISESKTLSFSPGMRTEHWKKNVFALGLSAGFLEPLESTSIYLIQYALNTLVHNFPRLNTDEGFVTHVNTLLCNHIHGIRDFIILHYAFNQRVGEAFWDECRHIALPESLKEKIALYTTTGRIGESPADFFRYSSWLSLYAGLDIHTRYYHPFVDNIDEDQLVQQCQAIDQNIQSAIQTLPSHIDFIRRNCPRKQYA